jgi:hypothetical protein
MEYRRYGLHSLIPNAEEVLALQPEELAGVVLQWWNSVPDMTLNKRSWGQSYTVEQYPEQYQRDLLKVLMEAWLWMEHEGLVAPEPADRDERYFITRRGRQIKTPQRSGRSATPICCQSNSCTLG